MKQIITLLFCLAAMTAYGQNLNLSLSEPFDEPDALDSKVVQSPNGNTFLFSFRKSDGIEVAVFDASHKRIATQNLTGGENSWDPKNMIGGMLSGVSKGSKVAAIYPIGNEMVIFLEQVAEREPALYRIRLSNKDGKLIKEEKIAEMPAYEKGSGYAIVFGHVQPKGFFVERDPASGAYAVLIFDGFAEETSKRIEIVHYDNNHQELGRSYFDAPETRYKYINYLGMVVNGTKEVHIATYCFGTNATTGQASKIFISRLSNKTLSHHPLDFTRDLKETKATLIYNPVTAHLELFTLSEVSAKTVDNAFTGPRREVLMREMFIVIDPSNYTILSNKMPTMMMSSQYRKLHYDKEEGRYTGVPMNVAINADGTTTVVMEDEIPTVSYAPGMGFVKSGVGQGVFINNMSTNVKSNLLQDVGITDYNEQGDEKYGYVVRKSQKLQQIIPPLSHQDMRNNRVTFEIKHGFGGEANSGFYSFDYISTPSGRYVIFNDHPKNFERDAEKNPKTLQGVSDANTICYKLNNGEMSKIYFFGEPNDSFDNRLALITSGDYSNETGDYATLMIEKAGRKKQARIAWVHLK